MGQLQTISFAETCTALSDLTLVSRRINTPFITRTISAAFPLGAEAKLQLSFYAAYDNDAPASGPPSGTSLLKTIGQIDYLCGDNDHFLLNHETPFTEAGGYIKVYAHNLDVFDHLINAQITLELLDLPPG